MKKLKESPDVIRKLGINWETGAPITFGYYRNRLYWAEGEEITHFMISDYYDDIGYINRYRFDYPGRAWPKHKVISFWEYPSVKQFRKIIKDLERETGYKMWNKRWKVEIIGDNDPNPEGEEWSGWDDEETQLIPVPEYGGSKEWSEKERGKQHVVSPMLKKKRKVPAGWGSKRIPKDIRPGETMAQYHFRTRQESKNIKLKDLIEVENKSMSKQIIKEFAKEHGFYLFPSGLSKKTAKFWVKQLKKRHVKSQLQPTRGGKFNILVHKMDIGNAIMAKPEILAKAGLVTHEDIQEINEQKEDKLYVRYNITGKKKGLPDEKKVKRLLKKHDLENSFDNYFIENLQMGEGFAILWLVDSDFSNEQLTKLRNDLSAHGHTTYTGVESLSRAKKLGYGNRKAFKKR